MKRMLSPAQKYEIWLQLVRQESTVAEVAAAQQVDRSTIMRIKQVARGRRFGGVAASKPGAKGRKRDYELDQWASTIRFIDLCPESRGT